jgi:ABC transport system ATP-binding/permease protein
LVGKLSGGERKRLQLLRILILNPNFLILDEPTNDLDLMTLNVLEDYLDAFEGCLMIVSHDRYFMDRLTDHLFVFQGEGKIKDFPGNYTDLREQGLMPSSLMPAESKKKEDKKVEVKVVAEDKKKLTYNEQREYDSIEGDMAKLEKEKNRLFDLMTKETGFDELQKVSKQIDEIKRKIEEKEMRWLELSERI